jgi:hypothetical protein
MDIVAITVVIGAIGGVVLVADQGSAISSDEHDGGTAVPSGVEELLQGDVDCDGDVDAVDALNDLRFVAALGVDGVEGCPSIGEVAVIQGPPGPPGPAGPGLSDREFVIAESEEDSSPFRMVSATCPSPKTATGGGARILAPGGAYGRIVIDQSIPIGASWQASARETPEGTESDWKLEVRIICWTLEDWRPGVRVGPIAILRAG